MKKLLLALGLLLPSIAYAADDAVIVTPGVGVTMKSLDVGAGVQAMQPRSVMSTTAGVAIYGTAGTANANVLSVQGIAAMTPFNVVNYGSGGTELFTSGNPGIVSGVGIASGGDIVTASPLGCIGLSTEQTAVTTGKLAYVTCDLNGRMIVTPYSPKALQVRGTNVATASTAAKDLIAAGAGSLKNYITDWMCSNSSATSTLVTFSDAAATVIIVPAGGGNNKSLHIPLATAAATAFSFTAGTSVSSVYCTATGFQAL